MIQEISDFVSDPSKKTGIVGLCLLMGIIAFYILIKDCMQKYKKERKADKVPLLGDNDDRNRINL